MKALFINLTAGVVIASFSLFSHGMYEQGGFFHYSFGEGLYRTSAYFVEPFRQDLPKYEVFFVFLFWLLLCWGMGYLYRRHSLPTRLVLGFIAGVLVAGFSYQSFRLADAPGLDHVNFGEGLYLLSLQFMYPFMMAFAAQELVFVYVFWIFLALVGSWMFYHPRKGYRWFLSGVLGIFVATYAFQSHLASSEEGTIHLSFGSGLYLLPLAFKQAYLDFLTMPNLAFVYLFWIVLLLGGYGCFAVLKSPRPIVLGSLLGLLTATFAYQSHLFAGLGRTTYFSLGKSFYATPLLFLTPVARLLKGPEIMLVYLFWILLGGGLGFLLAASTGAIKRS